MIIVKVLVRSVEISSHIYLCVCLSGVKHKIFYMKLHLGSYQIVRSLKFWVIHSLDEVLIEKVLGLTFELIYSYRYRYLYSLNPMFWFVEKESNLTLAQFHGNSRKCKCILNFTYTKLCLGSNNIASTIAIGRNKYFVSSTYSRKKDGLYLIVLIKCFGCFKSSIL
jgi:hypothetical protein